MNLAWRDVAGRLSWRVSKVAYNTDDTSEPDDLTIPTHGNILATNGEKS